MSGVLGSAPSPLGDHDYYYSSYNSRGEKYQIVWYRCKSDDYRDCKLWIRFDMNGETLIANYTFSLRCYEKLYVELNPDKTKLCVCYGGRFLHWFPIETPQMSEEEMLADITTRRLK